MMQPFCYIIYMELTINDGVSSFYLWIYSYCACSFSPSSPSLSYASLYFPSFS